MATEKVEISPTCHLVCKTYGVRGEGFSSDISLDYIEHSSSCIDTETSVDIDKEKAAEIIAFLTKCYFSENASK